MSLIKNGIIHEHHSSEGVLTCIPLIQSLLIVHLGGLSGGIDISGDPCTLCLRSRVLRLCFASEAVFNSFTLSSSSCKNFVRTKKNYSKEASSCLYCTYHLNAKLAGE